MRNSANIARRPRGFSMVEVLVALIVISVGMLGIAKIQALAYASTGTASMRSLAAIQAASLASAMRANRAYWGTTPPATFTIDKTGISDATLAAKGVASDYCKFGAATVPCTPVNLAGYDLHQWANSFTQVLPNPTATIACPAGTIPITCTIQLVWDEKIVSIDKNARPAAAAPSAPYVLYVEP